VHATGPRRSRGVYCNETACEHSPVPSKDLARTRGCPTPRKMALGGRKQKPRTDALAELLCSHAASGNLAGVREVLAEGADVNRGIYKGSASDDDLTEITPSSTRAYMGTRRACSRLSRRMLISTRSA
jgi:hypothetical protein